MHEYSAGAGDGVRTGPALDRHFAADLQLARCRPQADPLLRGAPTHLIGVARLGAPSLSRAQIRISVLPPSASPGPASLVSEGGEDGAITVTQWRDGPRSTFRGCLCYGSNDPTLRSRVRPIQRPSISGLRRVPASPMPRADPRTKPWSISAAWPWTLPTPYGDPRLSDVDTAARRDCSHR